MVKDAYIGDIFWFPPDQTITIPTADGPVQLSWRDVFREVAENRLSGGAMTLPLLLDGKVNELSKYQPPQAIPGASQVFEWEDRIDKQILRGADVPLEVIEAQENGGFSGRSVPLMVLLGVCTQEACEIVADVDEHLLRPTAWLNFGKEPEYTIIAKSLMESFASDAGGSAMGGGAMGGQPGQQRPEKPPPQQPQRPPMQFSDDEIIRAGAVQASRMGINEKIDDECRRVLGEERLRQLAVAISKHQQFDDIEGGQTTDEIATAGAASARSRIRGAASRIRALKKNELRPLSEIADLISSRDLRSAARLVVRPVRVDAGRQYRRGGRHADDAPGGPRTAADAARRSAVRTAATAVNRWPAGR
jgi:hypothetical protein